MTVINLFKRFAKENGVYGSARLKESLLFMKKFNEAFMPLNSFVWVTTKQGHSYWYAKALEWIVYLYDNLSRINSDDRKIYLLSDYSFIQNIYDLIENYHSDTLTKDELMKNSSYMKAKKLHNKINGELFKAVKWTSSSPYVSTSTAATTTITTANNMF